MFPLFEALKIDNGEVYNLPYHEERLNRSRREYLGYEDRISLKGLQLHPPTKTGLYKCRILYGKTIGEIEYIPYRKRDIRTLQLVFAEGLDYSHKYTDKSSLESLKTGLNPYSEILIVKDGFLTDTSFSNIALYDGKAWFTPATTLLRGTKRQFLLDSGMLSEREIRVEEIANYQKLSMINALLDLDELTVSTDSIINA